MWLLFIMFYVGYGWYGKVFSGLKVAVS